MKSKDNTKSDLQTFNAKQALADMAYLIKNIKVIVNNNINSFYLQVLTWLKVWQNWCSSRAQNQSSRIWMQL